MKDYTIDIVVLGNEFASAFAAKSEGTLSQRPLVVRKERGLPMSAAPFIAAREAIRDLMTFLKEDDIVDVRIFAESADVQTWIARGSGNPALDAELRGIITGLRDKGTSVSLHALAKPDRALHAKAEMALLMGG